MDENTPKNKNSGDASFSAAPIADANISYEELLKTKNLFEEMQRIVHFGIWEWDIKSNKCFLSDGCCSIFGLG